jgi:hypothetical protein
MMPLGIGDFESDLLPDPLAGAEEGQKLSTGTILIVVVIIVAAVGLFSMRKLSQMSFPGTESTSIEDSIEMLIKGIIDPEASSLPAVEDDPLLRSLNQKYSELQVPWDNVQGDPFVLFGGSEKTPKGTTPDDDDDDREARRAEIKAMFEDAASQLKLKMVVLGAPSMANVNDKIVRIGDSITVETGDGMVEFEVTAIESDSVKVLARDEEHDVTVERQTFVDRNF